MQIELQQAFTEIDEARVSMKSRETLRHTSETLRDVHEALMKGL